MLRPGGGVKYGMRGKRMRLETAVEVPEGSLTASDLAVPPGNKDQELHVAAFDWSNPIVAFAHLDVPSTI